MATTSTETRTATRAATDRSAQAVLGALAQAPDLSQRELAQRTGLSLTKAHFVLKQVIAQGLVEVRSSGRSSHRLGYVYVLTPAGRALHTRLAYREMQSAVLEFKGLLRRFRSTIARLSAEGVREVGLLGSGPLCEAIREVIDQDGRLQVVQPPRAGVLVVCDPEAEADYRGEARLIHLSDGERRSS